MKVLITGASGFLGKNLTEYLADKYQLFLPLHGELDLTDEAAVETYLAANKFDAVVHAAAVGISRKNNNPEALVQNLHMFANLARCRKLYGQMIFFGSGAEYDKRKDLVKVPEGEFNQSVPADPYGFYKYLCSLIIEGVPNIINLRIFAVFGKYEDYETRFISNAICRSLFGLPITINQDVKFDYFSVADLARVVEYFLGHKANQQFYNVGSGATIYLTDIIKKIEQLSGQKLQVTIKADGLNKEYSCDNSPLLAEIPGFEFTDFDETLKGLYNWYAEHRDTIDQNKLLFDK